MIIDVMITGLTDCTQSLMANADWIKPFYHEYELLCAGSLDEYAKEN